MESHVLIPEELCLMVRPETECSSPTVARLLEQKVGVFANSRLEKGTMLGPFQGTVRVGRLEVYSTLQPDDVRSRFAFDEIVCEGTRSRTRKCNWVRFLRTEVGEENNVANLICNSVNPSSSPSFEALESIEAGTELIVRFSDELANIEDASSSSHHNHQIVEDSALDLSLPLLNGQEEHHHHHHHSQSYPSTFLEVSAPSSSPPSSRIPSVSSVDSGVSSSGEDNASALSPSLTLEEIPPPQGGPTEDIPNNNNSIVVKKGSPSPSSKAVGGRRNKKMLPCDFCGKCFDRPSLLNRHLRTHTGERPHVCDICSKGFSTSSSLNTHRRIHSGEKPHQCGVCGKRFTASSNLYYHRMTHIKEKPHKCELCQKSFPTPGDLKSHMYVHNGSWPHRCHICDRGFSKVTNLRNHLFLHTGEKPHQCNSCGKRFALGCNMKAHMKTHDNENNTGGVGGNVKNK